MEAIQLKLSASKTPYLEFPNSGHISFCNWSKTDVGYRHLIFSFRKDNNPSFISDATMKLRNEDKRSLKSMGFYKTAIKPLMDIFEKLTDKEGIFPYKNLDKLGKMISTLKFEERIKIDPVKKRKNAKKKEREDEESNEETTEVVTKKVTRKGNISSKSKKKKKGKK